MNTINAIRVEIIKSMNDNNRIYICSIIRDNVTYESEIQKMALTINQGAGQLGFFISREAREIAQSMKLAYESTSTPDGNNSRLDQVLYMPVLCNSNSVRDVENWIYTAARSISDPRTNIFTRQLVNMRQIVTSPPRLTVKGYIRIGWGGAGPHQIIVLNDEQITIRVRNAGPVGSQLFQIDWGNYGYIITEDDGIDLTGSSQQVGI